MQAVSVRPRCNVCQAPVCWRAVSTHGTRRPVIGISIGFHDYGDYLGVGFQRPIAAAGGIPVVLPRLADEIDAVLDVCGGLLLAGGRDIAPAHYGHEPHEHLGVGDVHRDDFELALVRAAARLGTSPSSASAAACRC